MLRLSCLLFLVPVLARAQPAPAFGGELFLDYAVRVVAPDTHRAGEDGFLLRRAYLAATFTPAPRTTARIRFEVNDRSFPSPRLHDAYLRLDDAFGAGHGLTMGLLGVPEIEIDEAVWGYRVLERTLRDRSGRVDSRDLGVRVGGPLGGPLRYHLTLASGGSFQGPARRAGRLYGTLQAVRPRWQVALSGDAGYRNQARLGAVSVLAAHTPGRLRVGVEGFAEWLEAAPVRTGGGVFWAVPLRGAWTFAGRADMVWEGDEAAPFAVAALGYRVNEALHLLPGVTVGKLAPGADVQLTPRITAHARF